MFSTVTPATSGPGEVTVKTEGECSTTTGAVTRLVHGEVNAVAERLAHGNLWEVFHLELLTVWEGHGCELSAEGNQLHGPVVYEEQRSGEALNDTGFAPRGLPIGVQQVDALGTKEPVPWR